MPKSRRNQVTKLRARVQALEEHVAEVKRRLRTEIALDHSSPQARALDYILRLLESPSLADTSEPPAKPAPKSPPGAKPALRSDDKRCGNCGNFGSCERHRVSERVWAGRR